jgi:hypothetical protein
VRDALHLKGSDRIAYQIEGDRVIMTAAEKSVDELFGVFESPGSHPADYEELRRRFEKETALQVAEDAST